MTAIADDGARAERIAMNAREIEVAILRLIARLDEGEAAFYGLAEGRKLFAGLAARYEATARNGLNACIKPLEEPPASASGSVGIPGFAADASSARSAGSLNRERLDAVDNRARGTGGRDGQPGSADSFISLPRGAIG